MHRNLRIGNGAADNSLPGGGLRPGAYEGKIAGLYDLEETLGRGHFAVVKLAKHVFTGEKVAVKVIDKSKLDEVSKAHLFQEVRCMKLVQHPNVVRLYEVIDTATKLYLILELGDGGDLYDYIMRHDSGLSEHLAKEYFRQIVRAISYCHQLHVVHRDLKPENVVFFEKLGVVKLTDFGFSNKFCPGQKLETSCGSLAYSAPEILLGDSYDAPAVDIWSLGVILYMLVCGQAPFQEANDSETLTMIMDCKYSVPPHISKECQDLIARMLVRNPEKRANLGEIASHPWLAVGNKDNPPSEIIPLVSREQLSDEDHNLIVQKIVNGNIATKEEIQECLDKNEYNHITATYFLLAERKLKSKRQDQTNKTKRPEHLAVPQNSSIPKKENNSTGPTPCLLTVPRTPGDIPQRSRKCSIVQEDDEEEDISNCSGREELVPPLNRRGSRSEGRLNLALQERLAESEKRKPADKIEPPNEPSPPPPLRKNERAIIETKTVQISKWRPTKNPNCPESTIHAKIIKNMSPASKLTTTTIITDSSTVPIPVVTVADFPLSQTIPKFKTMPSPTRPISRSNSPIQLNEIFEEGDDKDASRLSTRQFVRNHNRTSYEQRRSKFHKARTASCSSSDASDDDSEKRKKRAHKLNTPSAKPFQGRRDSHDDSSDSQEPGTGAGTCGNSCVAGNASLQNASTTTTSTTTGTNQHKNGSTTTGGKKNFNQSTTITMGRRHRTSRRKNGETRLRESQSLNRITEVQEDPTNTIVLTAGEAATQEALIPKPKGLGARIIQGLTINMRRPLENKYDKMLHVSRKDGMKSASDSSKKQNPDDGDKESCNKLVASDKSSLRKMRVLGKYFQVHKKLCIPLPGLFSRNRLYKAQSCSSLVRDKITINSNVLHCRQRAVSVIRNLDDNINQNEKLQKKSSTAIHLNSVCNELTGICAVHIGQASKCCSFC